jgi:hypothetical protein
MAQITDPKPAPAGSGSETDTPAPQRQPSSGRLLTPAHDERFRARIDAAAAWEEENGRRVSRDDPDSSRHAILRTHMRRAARGKGTFAWTPERQEYADKHWPAWRA